MNNCVLVVHFIILLTLRSAVQVFASGFVEVRIDEFRNEQGRDAQNQCCSKPPGWSDSTSCELQCRTAFRICISPYLVTDCKDGSEKSEILGGNSFTFDDTNPYADNIIRIGFNLTWPGSFSLVIEAYHESGRTDGGPTIARMEKVIRMVMPGSTWRTQTQTPRGRRLRFSYRVLCDKYNYGSGCSEYCKPRDDLFGHWGCNSKGEKVCLEGWESSSEAGKDYCLKPKCVECDRTHGYCHEPNNCRCRYGWKGDYCNQCLMDPRCRHGTCEKPFQCICKQGWGGMFCNHDLNFCVNHKPCRNGARCRNSGLGSFTCECLPGYTGRRCEFSSKVCESNPCKNGGKCVATQTTASGFKCECINGYSGALCEDQYCASAPCGNGGTCTPKLNGYECSCHPNFSGQFCETRKNGCAQRVCLNGGSCEETVTDVRCVCSAGYTGTYCTERSCPKICKHGVCIFKNGVPQCDCDLGYSGEKCEHKDLCQRDICMNNGVCELKLGQYTCICNDGYSGMHCEHSGKTNGPNTNIIFYPNKSEGMSKTQTITVGLLSVLIIFLIIGLAICLIYPAKKRARYLRGMVKNRMRTQTVVTDAALPTPSETSQESLYELDDHEDDDSNLTIDMRPVKVKYRNVRPPEEGRRVIIRPVPLPVEARQEQFTTRQDHTLPSYHEACEVAKCKQVLV